MGTGITCSQCPSHDSGVACFSSSGQSGASVMLMLEGHRGKVRTLAFSPDGNRLVSLAGKDRRLWLWDLTEGQCIQQAQSRYSAQTLAFVPDDDCTVVSCDSMGSILRNHWDERSAPGWFPFATITIPAHHCVQLAFSPDARYLAVTGAEIMPTRFRAPAPWWRESWSRDGIGLWDWRESGRAPGPRGRFPHPEATCLTFSPDGQSLASGGLDRQVRIWDVLTNEPTSTFDHGKKVHFVCWSPDNRRLASATLNGFVKIWDLEHGRKMHVLSSKSKVIQGIAWSSDGAILTTADIDGVVRFWDVERGTLEKVLNWEIGEVHCVAFDHEGMRAAAGGEGRIMIWDMDFE